MHIAPNARTITRPRPLPQFLIANPRLEFSLNSRKQTHLKISNRERMAISAVSEDRNAGAIPPCRINCKGARLGETAAERYRVSSCNLYVAAEAVTYKAEEGAFMTIPSEVQRRFFRQLARASHAFPALDTTNPKPEMEACGQESFAALGGPWCIRVPIRAAKMETPAEEHMEETK
jgi:hypothetical protein